MATGAIDSHGTLLQMGDGGAPESFTTIAEVLDVTGPSLARDTHDATTHDSTASWEDVVVSVLRSGEVTFTVNYVPTGATHDASTGLIKKYVDGTKTNFKLVLPDSGNTTQPFAAFVTGLSPGAPVSGILTMDVTLKLTGQVVLV